MTWILLAYGLLGAAGVGLLGLLGYYLGHHEHNGRALLLEAAMFAASVLACMFGATRVVMAAVHVHASIRPIASLGALVYVMAMTYMFVRLVMRDYDISTEEPSS